MFKVCIELSTHPDTGIVAVADTVDALRFPASPPQEHVTGSQWWTDYQPVSYILTSKRGNRAQFSNMISTCHNAGVKIIAGEFGALSYHMSCPYRRTHAILRWWLHRYYLQPYDWL